MTPNSSAGAGGTAAAAWAAEALVVVAGAGAGLFGYLAPRFAVSASCALLVCAGVAAALLLAAAPVWSSLPWLVVGGEAAAGCAVFGAVRRWWVEVLDLVLMAVVVLFVCCCGSAGVETSSRVAATAAAAEGYPGVVLARGDRHHRTIAVLVGVVTGASAVVLALRIGPWPGGDALAGTPPTMLWCALLVGGLAVQAIQAAVVSLVRPHRRATGTAALPVNDGGGPRETERLL